MDRTTRKRHLIERLLQPGSLINKNGTVYNSDYLKDVKVFVLYFSAPSFCHQCTAFHGIMSEHFRLYHQTSKKCQVIFVSGDKSYQAQLAFMQRSPRNWPAVRCDSELQKALKETFLIERELENGNAVNMQSAFDQAQAQADQIGHTICLLPYVIAIKVSNGEVLTKTLGGADDIKTKGPLAFTHWEDSCIEIDTSIVNKLNKNTKEVFQEAKEILGRLLNNIIREPDNIKYRKVRMNNPKIENLLLNANGAFDVLFSVGFEENDENLILPLAAPMNIIKAFESAISNLSGPPSN